MDEELREVVREILAASRHDSLNDEFAKLLRVARLQIGAMAQIIKAFSDLYIEMTDQTEKRKWLERIVKRVERESARTKLDLWFWRPEKAITLEAQVRKRAIYLIEGKYSLDDTWDLLCEFITDYAHKKLDIEWLKDQITEAVGA